ncbi:MAG: hypothetical protein A3E01_10040 [Gammaproteobacteria bacterium RIFCSPHIGHO2_12_FULL_63_22]|nr:MAG: hypothetical protein A3E01_10040 [Gammaproteobacteria bacterium RIFCSPHIGHO2_12_FULL_63_22]
MGAQTGIEWTDATWNPIGGCEIHSPGCINCYAQGIAASGRLRDHPVYKGTTSPSKAGPVFNGTLTILPDDHAGWRWPLTWRGAKQPVLGHGKQSLIFVGDMSDLFHRDRGFTTIDRVVGTILLSQHTGQLLTKRADIMADYFLYPERGELISGVMDLHAPAHWCRREIDDCGGLPNDRLWLGFSAERQKEFDERWTHMRKLAEVGWTVFVSIEPMLGHIVLPDDFLQLGRRAQVICGFESGSKARPGHPDWARLLRDQCATASVPFFWKQWGSWIDADHWLDQMSPGTVLYKSYPTPWNPARPLNFDDAAILAAITGREGKFEHHSSGHTMIRVGKQSAGRLLDGKEWNQFPEVAACQ